MSCRRGASPSNGCVEGRGSSRPKRGFLFCISALLRMGTCSAELAIIEDRTLSSSTQYGTDCTEPFFVKRKSEIMHTVITLAHARQTRRGNQGFGKMLWPRKRLQEIQDQETHRQTNARAHLYEPWKECACAMNELGELVHFRTAIGVVYELTHPSRCLSALKQTKLDLQDCMREACDVRSH
jgi:hypothetical protein